MTEFFSHLTNMRLREEIEEVNDQITRAEARGVNTRQLRLDRGRMEQEMAARAEAFLEEHSFSGADAVIPPATKPWQV